MLEMGSDYVENGTSRAGPSMEMGQLSNLQKNRVSVFAHAKWAKAHDSARAALAPGPLGSLSQQKALSDYFIVAPIEMLRDRMHWLI